MPSERGPHYRKSTRLPEYDYASTGSYYVTIVVKDRLPLLGHIDDSSHYLTDAGHMVVNAWLTTTESTAWSTPDEFIVMPDHLHSIVTLEDDPDATATTTLSALVQRFKSYTTHEYGVGVRQEGWRAYEGKLWQMNYYERITRNEHELERFRTYIRDNPRRWAERRSADN